MQVEIKKIISRKGIYTREGVFLTIGLVQFDDNKYTRLVASSVKGTSFAGFPRKKFHSIKALEKYVLGSKKWQT